MPRSSSLPPGPLGRANSGRSVPPEAPNRSVLLRSRGYDATNGRVLSEGSFGSIRACERLGDGAVVAVKLIEQPTHRYATEKRVLEVASKGETPFVLALLDAFEAPGVACLVTPLYDGDAHDLLRAVRAQRRTEGVNPKSRSMFSSNDVVEANGLDTDTALTIIAHTAAALDWLHARKVAHRDLKPENVLCAGGGGPQARFVLADFGVVGVGCGPTTGARTLVGTPEYAAPDMTTAFLANGGDAKVGAGVLFLRNGSLTKRPTIVFATTI